MAHYCVSPPTHMMEKLIGMFHLAIERLFGLGILFHAGLINLWKKSLVHVPLLMNYTCWQLNARNIPSSLAEFGKKILFSQREN